MYKNFSKSALIVSSMTAILALGACGTSDSSDTGDSTTDDVVLTVGFWGSSGEDKAVEASLEKVAENVPGVKEVKLTQYATTADFYEKLPGQVAAGTAPDIVIATNEQHLQLIENQVLIPLEDYEFDLSGYAQNAIESWQYEGQQYGIPITAAASTFAINTDMWQAAGLGEYPTTWEEVYTASKSLTKDNVVGLTIDIGNIFHPTQYMNSFGGGWKDGTDINSQENIDALSYIFKMFDEGLATTAKDMGMTWDGEVFAAEKTAMSTGGTWYVGMMRESAPDVNYDFVSMPGGDGNNGSTLHSYGISVTSGTANKELAAQVAYYMSRQDAQEARAKLIGDRPSIEAALPAFREANPKLNVMDEYINQATSFGYPADQEFKVDFTTALESHVYDNDTTSAQEVLDSLAEKYGQTE